MKKKGITLTNAVTLIIAVLGIIALFYGFYKVYEFASKNAEQKNAQDMLNIIEQKINSLPENEQLNTSIRGFDEKWYITAWSKNDVPRPDKCFFSSCICVCKSGGETREKSCQDQGYCRLNNAESISIEENIIYQGEPVTLRDLSLPKKFIEINLQKNNGAILISSSTGEYIQDEQKRRINRNE